MQHVDRRIMTEAEYLELENASDVRHEYVNGRVSAMSGASLRHNAIVMNTGRALGNALEAAGRPCLVVAGDQRVHVAATGLYTYPDLAVTCEQAQLAGHDPKSLLNPGLIVEVLSPSTEHYDKTAKFAHYRSIASLAEILFIAQDKPHIDHYRRFADEEWRMSVHRSGVIELASLACVLALDKVYANLHLAGDT